ncbi:Predicted exporter protein, RND superfamily [Natrinema hispanicum]|uniref:Predicted exporter protein, RND superfamily n=1 Tax=Natrinema hispanicum TaxID=392421 RepID=A0A1G6PZD4_9EURY|nr:Predicted exporter protein, RND superfamily [Natrinema hispanicum]SET31802.1 Predicted exporter protein, RND superfamily [Natrinema hispanicum]
MGCVAVSRADRIADVITTHSAIVLVVLLLVTAMVGAGATMVDDESSLEQYESDSPEGNALEFATENFASEDQENTTAVQVIVRGDDVLSKESLRSSLEFQQELRNDESINSTLVEEEAIVGVENVVATTAIREEQADDLSERASELEDRSEELNETAAELEQRRAELNETAAELETRSGELNETAAELEAALNETVALETESAELNASFQAGDLSEAEYEQQSAALEGQLDAVYAEATADLGEEQSAQFDTAMTNAREIQSSLVELERANEAGNLSDAEYEQRSAELEGQLEDVYAQGTRGVLEEDFAQLAEDREQLQDDFEDLEDDSEQLQDDFEDLEDDFEELEDDREDLEAADQPPLDEQIEQLDSMSESEYEETLTDVLSEDSDRGGGFALRLMPTSYEPESTEADARMLVVTQSTASGDFQGPGSVDEEISNSQLELRDLADDYDQEMLVFGSGVITDEIDRSMGDSLAIVSPLALLFVVVALVIAYRDPLDIVLGIAGIAAVLLWTFGFMGWADISFNQMFVAIPVLLIGLSIDYAIHVFMRHREQRETPRDADEPTDVRGSMSVALAGVGVALVWVTATTVIGFLSNLVSPIGPIREFGIVSAFGILAAMVVFGALIPAAKVEVDSRLEAYGIERRKRAFGTGGGRLADVLSVGATIARKAPLVVLLVTLVVTAGGVYGATQVDTSFDQEDFLADSPPAWTQDLPEPFQPGEYSAKSDLEYVNENFQRQDSQAQLLVRGDITHDETLERVADAQDDATDSDVAYELASGEADVRSPLSTMEQVAAENESFDESFDESDTDDDGVPDENLEALYDDLYEADSEAATNVLYRTDDGEYEALQLVVSIQGDASTGETTEEMRAIAADFDDSGDRWSVVATGDPIVNHVVEQDLLNTVLESLLITLVAVFVFLTLAYWLTGNSATLGAVTLLPVALAVSWILGTMYLIGMPFNVLTGMITSLTIGLGVAYSIHVSARYTLELERQGSVWDAMQTTVTGTGGALLGSAATTVGGFGVLAFAILPVLEQFGIITALTIIYAFIASVLVLPTLLVLWTRYFGPDVPFESPAATGASPASDGGRPADGTGDEQ